MAGIGLERVAGRGGRSAERRERYESILVTEEDAAQVDRLRYLLENSCMEGLVDSPIH